MYSSEVSTWQKSGDEDVWNFGGAVRELSKKFGHFGLKGLPVAERDWDVNDWEIVFTEGRFGLGKEDGRGNIIKDDCDKHDDGNCDEDCDYNPSCNVSITDFENLMFPFSRWSLRYSSMFNGLPEKVQPGPWCMKVILLNFSQ